MIRNPKKVFIGLALGDGRTRWETSMSLIQLVLRQVPGYEFTLVPGGGCDVAHARNLLNHEFMTRTDCGIAIHIDSDIQFVPEHIERLLKWFENPSVHFCAGLYPMKGETPRWSFGLWSQPSTKVPGLLEIGEACGGFTAYRYTVAEMMCQSYPDAEYQIDDEPYRGETGHELFAMGPIEARDWNKDGKPYRRRMSEDFMFSMRARDIGFTIFADPAIQLGHIGTIDYRRLMPKP